MKQLITLGILLLVLFNGMDIASAQEEAEPEGFSRRGFSLTYPGTGWKLQEKPAREGSDDINLEISADDDTPVSIILSLSSSYVQEAQTKDTPYAQELATAFGLPIALSIAEKKEENIFNSVGLINFDQFYELSSRFLILKPGSQKTVTLDAFSYHTDNAPKKMVLGAVIFQGDKNPSRVKHEQLDRILEAYGIVQSIKIKGGK